MLIYLCGVLVFLPVPIYLCGVCIYVSVQMYIYITEKSGSILLCNVTFPTQAFSTSCAHIYQPNYFSLEQLHSSTQYRNSIVWKLGQKNHALVDWTLRFSLFSAIISYAMCSLLLFLHTCTLLWCELSRRGITEGKAVCFSMCHSLWDSFESMLGSMRRGASAWPPLCLWKLTGEGPLLCGGGQRLGRHSTGKYPTAPEAATVMPFLFDLWEAESAHEVTCRRKKEKSNLYCKVVLQKAGAPFIMPEGISFHLIRTGCLSSHSLQFSQSDKTLRRKYFNQTEL